MNLVKFQHTPGEQNKHKNERTHPIFEIIVKGTTKWEPMWTYVACSDAHWMFHHYQLLFVRNIRNTKKFSLFLVMLSLNITFVHICGLSHESPKYPWHLYGFCSLFRLWISKWRFHSWHVGGVLVHRKKNTGDVIEGKSSRHPILIGFSIMNHPFWGTPIFGNTQLEFLMYCRVKNWFNARLLEAKYGSVSKRARSKFH